MRRSLHRIDGNVLSPTRAATMLLAVGKITVDKMVKWSEQKEFLFTTELA